MKILGQEGLIRILKSYRFSGPIFALVIVLPFARMSLVVYNREAVIKEAEREYNLSDMRVQWRPKLAGLGCGGLLKDHFVFNAQDIAVSDGMKVASQATGSACAGLLQKTKIFYWVE